MSAFIRLTDISKVYGRETGAVKALDGISLEIRQGEKICIIGKSGSGKSTLVDIIGTLLVPTAGHYEFMGVSVTGMSPSEVARLRNRHFGFVFQSYHLMDRYTVLRNIEMVQQYRPREHDFRERAVGILQTLGLGGLTERLPTQLSGGERQRVAIARALAGNPSVLLADEPTGNLDSDTGAQVMRELFAACGDKNALILVTHDISFADLFSRVLRMRDGRLVGG